MRTISIDGEPLFLYLIEWGRYEREFSVAVAHREELTEEQIRKRLGGDVETSARLPFPYPAQLEALGFVTLKPIEIFPGNVGE